MIFRKARINDMEEIQKIYDSGSALLQAMGIDQWQGDDKPKIKEAMLPEVFVLEDNRLIGTALLQSYDPQYDEIDGRWRFEGPYLAIHRFGSLEKTKGIGYTLMGEIKKWAQYQGVEILRVDTHRENQPMQRLLEKSGFEKVGIIRCANGDLREAYDLNLREI